MIFLVLSETLLRSAIMLFLLCLDSPSRGFMSVQKVHEGGKSERVVVWSNLESVCDFLLRKMDTMVVIGHSSEIISDYYQ